MRIDKMIWERDPRPSYNNMCDGYRIPNSICPASSVDADCCISNRSDIT